MVKAYGVDDNLPIFDYKKLVPNEFAAKGLTNDNYLELSTEGGTLWRSATQTDEAQALGDGVTLGSYGDFEKIYVDTMVQFTPTEDGGTPATEAADKLAIWLNVATNEETGEATTNLCVRAGVLGGSPQTHTITNAGEVKPGVWYRLTVKYVGDVTKRNGFPGFMIWLDGKKLQSDAVAIDEGTLNQLLSRGVLTAEEVADVNNGSVFGSLEGEGVSEPVFMGVGFKGSGAIDDLQIGDEDPNFFTAAGSLDFTLSWGEGVSAVSYTIGGVKTAAVNGQKVECDAGEVVTIEATAADWYVIDSASVAALTVDAADTTRTITASLAATPADAEAAGLDGVTTADAKAWADAKGLTPALITACEFAKDAYLMNTDLSAAPGLQITSITEVEGGWQITVKGTQGDNAVTLDGIRGVLQVKAAAALTDLATATPATYGVTLDENGVATIKVTGEAKNFMKATVGLPAAE